MIFTLENEKLTVGVESFGAEVKSVKSRETGREYMWCADEKYWKRTSPVLFPLVGSLRNKSYLYEGERYPMSQHGFARDMEFSLVSRTQNCIWMELKSNADTLKVYPFDFVLQIGYELTENRLKVMWKVVNPAEEKTMYFSIGAHPAFNCPINGEKNKVGYGVKFNSRGDVIYSRVNRDGLLINAKEELKLERNLAIFTEDFFAEENYLIEDYQASEVSLMDLEGKPYVTVEFDAPLFCIWSPGDEAPFVCIEPWYGRCDRETFEGRLEEREWGQKLASGEIFEKNYTITFS